jgi:pantoate--beta-alanine ligase
MIIFKKAQDIKNYISDQKGLGSKPGFVPTMGALHEGHLSLVSRAKADGMLAVCSIFVNPTQFNDKTDFEKYPITTEADIEMLINGGCDVLYLPSYEEVYPGGEGEARTYDFGYLDTILEGAQRPGHFKGVGQVVARLLDTVTPDKLYLGQKDYQQCMVLSDLIRQMGIAAETVICPIVREADGLAMSSRNRRLTDPQRAKAGIIYQCLVSVESKKGHSAFAVVRKECEELLTAKGLRAEYVALADARDLRLLDDYDDARPMVTLIAAWLGDVRLIDNMVIG